MEEHQTGWHPEYTVYEQHLRERGLVSLEKRRLGGTLTAILSYLKGGSREDRARLFSEVCRKRRRGNRSVTVKEIPIGQRKGNFPHWGSHTQKLTAQRGWEASRLGSRCCVLP